MVCSLKGNGIGGEGARAIARAVKHKANLQHLKYVPLNCLKALCACVNTCLISICLACLSLRRLSSSVGYQP